MPSFKSEATVLSTANFGLLLLFQNNK